MDLSIVIASYNTCDVTRRCLRTIIQQTTGLEYEIIVVDNASTDGSIAMIETEFPSAKLIRNRENRGFAAAQNAGLRRAHGRDLLILNSDVLLVGNAAKLMLEHLREGPDTLGVIGPQILHPDGTVAPSARRALLSRPMIGLSVLNRHFNFRRLLPEPLMRRSLGFLLARWHDNYASHDTVTQVDYVDGMCVLVKREVLEQVGLFDEQFFFDAEIIDLSNRIRTRGWTIEFFPGAQVIHLGHSSRRKLSRIIVDTHRSELIYYAKYAPANVPFVNSVVLVVVALKALCVKTGLLFTQPDESRREALQLYEEIMKIGRQFDPTSVWGNERIPALPSLQSAFPANSRRPTIPSLQSRRQAGQETPGPNSVHG